MARGHDRERAVKRILQDDDWLVVRAAGSLGFDLIACRAGVIRVIEVKSTAGGPYERFSPADRAKLLLAAELAGGRAELAWWPPRGKLRWIPADEWPRLRAVEEAA